MENYPANSKHPQRSQPEPKKVERIAISEVRQRKPSRSRRWSENLVGGDVRGTGGWLVAELILPTIRDLLVNLVKDGVERIVYPDSVPNRNRNGMRGGPVNYAGMSSRGPVTSTGRNEPTRRGRSSYDIDDLLFNHRSEAMDILDRLEFYLDKYSQASVSDLYGLVGIPSTHVDNNWGWSDLSMATIRHVKDGYLLILPRPESFK